MKNKDTSKSSQSNVFPESLQAMALANIKKEQNSESLKRYYTITRTIANSLHEICTQLVMIAFCIQQLKKQDAKNVCKALKLSPDLMEALCVYMQRMDNLPKDLREKALSEIQKKLIEPIVNKIVRF